MRLDSYVVHGEEKIDAHEKLNLVPWIYCHHIWYHNEKQSSEKCDGIKDYRPVSFLYVNRVIKLSEAVFYIG